MADLPDQAVWENGIYQWETDDPVIGGPPDPVTKDGLDNVPTLQLANRTRYLRAKLNSLLDLIDDGLTDGDLDALLRLPFLRADGDDSGNGAYNLNFLHAGGPIASSNAKLQVNGFMRTGRILIHEQQSETDLPLVNSVEALQNRGGNLTWGPSNSRIWHDGQSSRLRAVNGYEILPSGLVLQWGFPSGQHNQVINFPIAFPTRAAGVLLTENHPEAALYLTTQDVTSTGYRLQMRNLQTNAIYTGVASQYHYFAIGY